MMMIILSFSTFSENKNNMFFDAKAELLIQCSWNEIVTKKLNKKALTNKDDLKRALSLKNRFKALSESDRIGRESCLKL